MASSLRSFFRPSRARRWRVLVWFLFPLALQAQELPNFPSPGQRYTDVQFPNTPIPIILLEYERITGKRIIRDSNIAENTLDIQTAGRMTYEEAATFIEKSLLLNGYAIIPTDTPNQSKIIAYNADKKPVSEGVPVITSPEKLPDSDQVVTYIMPLTYLTPEAAAELFTAIVDLHPYGKVTPLSNATALVITENTTVIRRLLELQNHLDVTPARTVDRSFDLERADAEEVVEALTELLDLDEANSSPTTPAQAQAAATGQNGIPAPPVIRQVSAAVGGETQAVMRDYIVGRADRPRPTNPKPRVRAITRTNQVLVIASPGDMEVVTRLIDHLDAPSDGSCYFRFKLEHLEVADFLDIASNVLLRGQEDSGSQQPSGGTRSNPGTTTNRTTPSNALRSSGSGGSSAATGDLENAGLDEAIPPQSIVIGRTLLVADNVQNMLIASGPPEHLAQIKELVACMDVRAPQIQISAIIAQLNLGDDYEFGFDFLRSFEDPSNGINGNAGGSFVTRTGQSRTLLDVATLNDVTNLLPAAQGLTFYGQVNPYLDGFIAALDSTNRFKVLSRPTIYTVNGRQAVIETGQRIAVPRSTLSSLNTTGAANNQVVTANIDFEDVVLRISVRPRINSRDEITLQIQQRNDDIVGSQLIGGDEIPTIGTQSLGTTVIVQDGGTVLLGGLISEEDSKAESGLPLFANLPMLGRVFGSTQDNVQRQELLIFIQPKVIRHPSDQTRVDRDLKNRTRISTEAEDFADNVDNNLDLFETEEFNPPDNRIHYLKNLFGRKSLFRKSEQGSRGEVVVEPSAHARPVPATPVREKPRY